MNNAAFLFLLLVGNSVAPSLPSNYIYQYSDGTQEYANTQINSIRRDFGDQSIVATPDASYHISWTFLDHALDVPLCVQIDGTVTFPPNSDATVPLGSGTYQGTPVDIWAGYGDELWYVQNSPLDILIPVALAFPSGQNYLFDDVSIVLPTAADFAHPSCYNFYQDTMNSDDTFTFPPTHSYSLRDTNGNLNTYTVDGLQDKYSVIRYGSDGNTFYYVKTNNTNYSYIKNLNISPLPCILSKMDLENQFLTGSSTFIDTITVDAVGDLDVYSSGDASPTEYILFLQNEQPLSVFTPFGQQGPRLIVGYSETADPNNFNVPTCYSPFTNYPMKRDYLAPPVFPSDFTLYFTPIDGQVHTQSGVVYYDAPNSRIRVDYPGRDTHLAIGQALYIFPSDVDARSAFVPFPCSSTVIPTLSLWHPPIFTNLITNGTVDGKAARLWKATKDYPQETQRPEFWYLSTDGSPLFSFTAAFFGQFPEFIKYTFYQAGSPPPGVFDVPTECKIL